MDEFEIKVYQREIHRQAEYALMSFEQMDAELQELVGNHSLDPAAHQRFWFHMDAALGAVARMADILWPEQNRKGSKARGAELCAHFGLGPAAHVTLREVRNGFEHFAERIDEWRAGGSQSLADTNIGSKGDIDVPGIKWARHYDPDTGIVSVFDRELDLVAVSKELMSIVVIVPDPDEHVI